MITTNKIRITEEIGEIVPQEFFERITIAFQRKFPSEITGVNIPVSLINQILEAVSNCLNYVYDVDKCIKRPSLFWEQVVPIVNNHKYSLHDKLSDQSKRRPMAIYIKIP